MDQIPFDVRLSRRSRDDNGWHVPLGRADCTGAGTMGTEGCWVSKPERVGHPVIILTNIRMNFVSEFSLWIADQGLAGSPCSDSIFWISCPQAAWTSEPIE